MTMVEISKDLLPTTKLLLNGVPAPQGNETNPWPEYHDLVFHELGPPHFDIKLSVSSRTHQYFTNYELDAYLGQAKVLRTPFTSKFTGAVDYVRARGKGGQKVS